MRFLIDADLPRSSSLVVQSCGHIGIDVRDIGMRTAQDPLIASYAQQHQLCILTGDFGFGDVRRYVPADYAGIVVFEFENNSGLTQRMAIIEWFLRESDVLNLLPGRLAIVSMGKVRLRPPP